MNFIRIFFDWNPFCCIVHVVVTCSLRGYRVNTHKLDGKKRRNGSFVVVAHLTENSIACCTAAHCSTTAHQNTIFFNVLWNLFLSLLFSFDKFEWNMWFAQIKRGFEPSTSHISILYPVGHHNFYWLPQEKPVSKRLL